MSKGRTGIHKQGGLNVQGDKRKYQEPPQQIDIGDTETIICENVETHLLYNHSF